MRSRFIAYTIMALVVLTGLGCDSGDGSSSLCDGADQGACAIAPLRLQGHDNIASEDATLTLIEGTLFIRRITLGAGDREVVWLEHQRIDLTVTRDEVVVAPLPAGTYDRIVLEYGPDDGSPTADLVVQAEGREPLHATYEGEIFRERPIDVPVTVAEGSGATLSGMLQTLFFYVRPYSLSTDGVLVVDTADDRIAFETNLVNLLRPTPL